MATRIQSRRDTASGWVSANPVLAAGEIGIETDNGGMKFGDGTTAWTSLRYESGFQEIVLSSAYTLANQTGAQLIFGGAGGTTNGAVTLPVGTYEFECMFSLTSMSATSGSYGFALAGTATYTQSWMSIAVDTATATTAANPQMTFNTAANTTLCTASTGTTGAALIKGVLRVTAAGTVIPQVSQTTAAAAVVGVNSYFRVNPVSSSATAISVGNWS